MTESVTGSAGGVNYNIAQAPLYFVRSGRTLIYYGKLRYPGQGGNWWSSRAYSTTSNGYRLNFNATDVYPSYYDDFGYRYAGNSLRCLSTVLDI